MLPPTRILYLWISCKLFGDTNNRVWHRTDQTRKNRSVYSFNRCNPMKNLIDKCHSHEPIINKAIRDGRPRPPRHQVGWDIPLHFDTNPESLRPFVAEIWPNNVFNLSATYDLDLWPKILKIFVSHGVPIRNMYAKFHNDRLRNGWDITHWNFAKTRTNTQTHRHGHYNTSPSPYGGRGKYTAWADERGLGQGKVRVKMSNAKDCSIEQ